MNLSACALLFPTKIVHVFAWEVSSIYNGLYLFFSFGANAKIMYIVKKKSQRPYFLPI